MRGRPDRPQRGKRTMHDEQTRPPQAIAAAPRRRLLLVALALLAPAILLGGYLLLRGLPNDCIGQQPVDSDPPPARPIQFAGWGQPDLALVISGQLHGYLKPCGCSPIQFGGMARRLVFINELKAKGWEVAAIDLGELAADTGIPRQRELKLLYATKALDLMGYKALGLGKNEMVMPLAEALIQYSAEHAQPRPIASSLDIENKGRAFADLNVRPYEIFGGTSGAPRIGVLTLTGPDLADSFRSDRSMKFLNNSMQVLPRVQEAFAKQKVDMAILMHHEYPKDPATGDLAAPLKMESMRYDMAEKCAESWEAARKEAARKKKPLIPPLQLLMVLTHDSEPRGLLRRVPNTPTYILEIGHKGKYVGVVGVFRKGGNLELKYEMVLMEPKLDPKVGQPNAINDVLEEYARQVQSEDLLAKYIRAPHPIQIDPYVVKNYGGSDFVGSERCMKCHRNEAAVFRNTAHSHAFDTLVTKAKNPSLRQFDPECVICHTVGFKHPQGYNHLPGGSKIELAQHNQKLAHVGCESCHGPGSAHANKNQHDPKLHELMNPFRPSAKETQLVQQMGNPALRQEAAAAAKSLFDRRMDHIDQFCQKCHDLENDVNWSKVPFLDKWSGGRAPIVHNRRDNVGNIWMPPRNPSAAIHKAD
jgi:hypothetical protein